MTVEVFARDYVPVIQTAITLVGLVGVFLLWWQIRQTRLWNKLRSPHNFLDVDRAARLEKEVFSAMRLLTIDPNRILEDQDVDKIIANDDANIVVKAFLNDLENICAGVTIGLADEDCAYAVHSCRVIEISKRYRRFIERTQKLYDDPEVFIEIQKVAAKWETRALKDAEAHEKQLKAFQDRLSKKRGAQSKT